MSETTPTPHPRIGADRPLSPHIQVYRPLFTMVMSIVHRITGVGLYFGMFLLAWWLFAAASGPDYFNWVQGFFGSWFGQVILFGFTWALLHHMLGGLRHFVWDTGHGFGEVVRETMAKATLAGSVILTVLVWIIGYMVR
ncbi:succinate dehydrogenase, cytochrome b556 subunit [Pararhizobium sp. IMCC21322]|uniref:succinate dehydrogenase, cytochrome b556 subunit n=1 Tax=Pararhizobium sp. IMCC21322 TaxID=3067903 RepID=UPI0027418560|nr:succinate dehydrogenase, cytochrome b556 subunit [Pararhizobium sp. IMCC21322]